jgi:acetyl esterase
VPVDPELTAALGGPDDSNMDDIVGSRAIAAAHNALLNSQRPPLAPGLGVRDTTIPTASGHAVPIRIYQRETATPPTGGLLYIHGGGFIFGDLDSEHDRCLAYLAHTDIVIVSVDYRLAPEHPYPAGLDDCDAALRWFIDHATELGVDPGRIAVGGASAGGALAAGVALRCRDAGIALAAQMLIYPVLDDRGESRSMTTYDDAQPWSGRRNRQMWPLYLGHDGPALADAAPARAMDLGGLAPTYLMTCEEDPLRDEEFAYAQRLLDHDVPLEFHHYPGTYHAFDVIVPQAAVSQRAIAEQAEFLRRHLTVAN